MHIHWKHKCFVCENPIDIHVNPETTYEYVAYYHYRFIYNPMPLYMNMMYYKFIDKKLRRVCLDCFARHKKPNFRTIRDREIGRCRMRPRQFLSLTRDEIAQWVHEMELFMYPPESDASSP
jgi:hypothetical protein